MAAAAGRAKGYEYGYRFAVEDELVSRYKHQLRHTGTKPYLFEVTANFIVRTINGGGDRTLDSERYHDVSYVDPAVGLFKLSCRFNEYWMNNDETISFKREAMDFVRKTVEDPELAPRCVTVVPVSITVEVRTVQQEGEVVESVIQRAIRAEDLIPLHLWLPDESDDDYYFLKDWLELPRVRVEDVEEVMDSMEYCGLCSRAPVVGAQVSEMPCCGRAYHSLCALRHLLVDRICPSCRESVMDSVYYDDVDDVDVDDGDGDGAVDVDVDDEDDDDDGGNEYGGGGVVVRVLGIFGVAGGGGGDDDDDEGSGDDDDDDDQGGGGGDDDDDDDDDDAWL